MGLFDMFKSKPQPQNKSVQPKQEPKQPEIVISVAYKFESSPYFKGFKRGSLYAKGCQGNIDKLNKKYNGKYSGLNAMIKKVERADDSDYFELYIDDLKVGYVYETGKYYDELCNGLIEGIYAENEVKVTINSDSSTTERNHVKILYKLSE